ncbi:hypothetical protein QBC39DRAFT_431810 [Podospora conica]|nr:hypothetical protein QBC39DRAFT_431810 [Schizothecium conicum]
MATRCEVCGSIHDLYNWEEEFLLCSAAGFTIALVGPESEVRDDTERELGLFGQEAMATARAARLETDRSRVHDARGRKLDEDLGFFGRKAMAAERATRREDSAGLLTKQVPRGVDARRVELGSYGQHLMDMAESAWGNVGGAAPGEDYGAETNEETLATFGQQAMEQARRSRKIKQPVPDGNASQNDDTLPGCSGDSGRQGPQVELANSPEQAVTAGFHVGTPGVLVLAGGTGGSTILLDSIDNIIAQLYTPLPLYHCDCHRQDSTFPPVFTSLPSEMNTFSIVRAAAVASGLSLQRHRRHAPPLLPIAATPVMSGRQSTQSNIFQLGSWFARRPATSQATTTPSVGVFSFSRILGALSSSANVSQPDETLAPTESSTSSPRETAPPLSPPPRCRRTPAPSTPEPVTLGVEDSPACFSDDSSEFVLDPSPARRIDFSPASDDSSEFVLDPSPARRLDFSLASDTSSEFILDPVDGDSVTLDLGSGAQETTAFGFSADDVFGSFGPGCVTLRALELDNQQGAAGESTPGESSSASVVDFQLAPGPPGRDGTDCVYALVSTDDGPDVMFFHPGTQAFQELMPDEFHRFEYLYPDWENVDSPQGTLDVLGPSPVGIDDPFLGFDGDFADGIQQLSPSRPSDKKTPTFDFLPDELDSDSSDNDEDAEEEESDDEDFDNSEIAWENTAFNRNELADEWEVESDTDNFDNAETVRINMLLNAVMDTPDKEDELLGDLDTGSPRKTKKTVRFSESLEEIRSIPHWSDLDEYDIEDEPAPRKKRVHFFEEVEVCWIPNRWGQVHGADTRKRVHFSDDLEAIRYIPNRWQLAAMEAEGEDDLESPPFSSLE